MRKAVFLFCLLPFASGAEDLCEPSSQEAAHLELVTSRLDSVRHVYYGRFQLSVPKDREEVRLSGIEKDGVLTLPGGRRTIQFLDLNGRWVSLILVTGSNVDKIKTVSVAPGRHVVFDVPLFNEKIAAKSASDFRVVVRNSDYSKCFVSKPFRVMPERPTPTHLQSVQNED